MKRILTASLILFIGLFSADAQTLTDDVKAKKAEITAKKKELTTLENQLIELEESLEADSKWNTGFGGILGFNLNQSNNWIRASEAAANSTVIGLNINGNAYANKIGEKAFWRNTGIINMGWQKLDLDNDQDGEGFERTTDILNLSSLGGYRLTKDFAATGLAELNTAVGNFLSPGTFDLGIGGTYTGIEGLVLVLHPLNMRVAFPQDDARMLDTETFIGGKIRADYTRAFDNGINWSTNFTLFTPYTGEFVDADGQTISGREWTWLNTVTFPVWNGIGLGINFGLRNAPFEYDGTQNFYGLGLSYTL